MNLFGPFMRSHIKLKNLKKKYFAIELLFCIELLLVEMKKSQVNSSLHQMKYFFFFDLIVKDKLGLECMLNLFCNNQPVFM